MSIVALPFAAFPADSALAAAALPALEPHGLAVAGALAPLAAGALVNIGSADGLGPVDSFTLEIARLEDGAFRAKLTAWDTQAAAEGAGATDLEAIAAAFRAWFA